MHCYREKFIMDYIGSFSVMHVIHVWEEVCVTLNEVSVTTFSTQGS